MDVTSDTLPDLLRQLAVHRRTVATATTTIKQIESRVRAENDLLYRERAEAVTAIEATESQVRALAVEQYTRTGEKKPTRGVEIKIRTSYDYTPEAALAWARETKLCLVPEALDAKAFAKIASVQPLPFVAVRETPTAQIATDLDAALAGVAA